MRTRVILALLKKDLRSLRPLVLLAWVAFLLQPIIAGLDVNTASEGMVVLQGNFYWVGYFLCLLLMISVLQLDPAASLTHDWLTRPIPRIDLLIAKLLFLVVAVCIPVIVSRFILTLGEGYSVGTALAYAMAIEKLPAVLPVPLFFAIALMTPNLRKFLQATIAVFFLFLLPAWNITRPLLAMLGVGLSGDFDSMMWLQALPIVVLGTACALLVYWCLYGLRRQRLAKLAFAACIATYFFAFFPPRSLYDWDEAIAVHTALINETDDALDAAVILNPVQACFPAFIAGVESNGTADQVFLEANWYNNLQRRAMEPGALTFATTVQGRDVLENWVKPAHSHWELPVDWRIDRIRTKARFTAASLAQDVELDRSPAPTIRLAPISSTKTDYWLASPDLVTALANDPTTKLVMDYDLALLSPTPYLLPTDGQRYHFAELGSCKAELDNGTNNIEVECMKRGPLPALVSAQLVGVEASRVDNARRTNLKPDWLEAFGRQRYELTLPMPSLVDSSEILLTAYKVERMVHKQVVFNGLLGNTSDVCPLPGSDRFVRFTHSTWSDTSPHEVNSVAVEAGVRVEVLDWRREPRPELPTLFLLPGLGATVHSYDVIAAKLAEKYNVVGMTRRGVGESSKPDHGYDVARLSQDVLEVIETLGIAAPVLVGHSIAGEELSYLGANHPERFSGLVYLDAAYDRTLRDEQNRHMHELTVSLPRSADLSRRKHLLCGARRIHAPNRSQKQYPRG